MQQHTMRVVLAALAAAALAASPLAAASCKSSGEWREEKTALDSPLRGRVSINADDPSDGWTVTQVDYFVAQSGGSWGSALETTTDDVVLDGTRKRLWQEKIPMYLNDGSTNTKTARIRVQLKSAAGVDVVCAVHFEGKDFVSGSEARARFEGAYCWDETGTGVRVDNETHPYVSCERNFLNGQNRFNVVLRLKDR